MKNKNVRGTLKYLKCALIENSCKKRPEWIL